MRHGKFKKKILQLYKNICFYSIMLQSVQEVRLELWNYEAVSLEGD